MANKLNSKGFNDITIKKIKPSFLMDLLKKHPGISVIGTNGIDDYSNSSEEAIQILRKFC